MILLRKKISGVTVKALEEFAALAQKAAHLRGEICILITTSEEVRQLNRDFRHKNQPTDVLSFPSVSKELAGDIAISGDIAKENAHILRHATLTELKILILHGILHLAGQDHETDSGEMAKFEAKLRAKLALPVGLIERAHAQAAPIDVKRTVAKKASVKKVGGNKRATKNSAVKKVVARKTVAARSGKQNGGSQR